MLAGYMQSENVKKRRRHAGSLIIRGIGALSVILLSSLSEVKPPGGIATDLYVPEGLEARLWAESPMFYNPTSIDVDHRGRIWVAEAVNYRSFKNNSAGKLSHPGAIVW